MSVELYSVMERKSVLYICRGRKSNLVEFQILPVESLIGYINLVESQIGVSTGRTSNLGDMGVELGFEI